MWQHSALSTENLQEAKLKSFGLMALAEEISRQPSTDCYVVLVIALKIWFKSVSFHLKDPEKWSFLLQMIQVRKTIPDVCPAIWISVNSRCSQADNEEQSPRWLTRITLSAGYLWDQRLRQQWQPETSDLSETVTLTLPYHSILLTQLCGPISHSVGRWSEELHHRAELEHLSCWLQKQLPPWHSLAFLPIAVVLGLWAATPSGAEWPFHRHCKSNILCTRYLHYYS